MKLYNYVLQEGLTHAQVMQQIIGKSAVCLPKCFTRPEWDGFHFLNKKGRYCIMFKDKHVEEVEIFKVWDRDKDDWIEVVPNAAALEVLLYGGHI